MNKFGNDIKEIERKSFENLSQKKEEKNHKLQKNKYAIELEEYDKKMAEYNKREYEYWQLDGAGVFIREYEQPPVAPVPPEKPLKPIKEGEKIWEVRNEGEFIIPLRIVVSIDGKKPIVGNKIVSFKKENLNDYILGEGFRQDGNPLLKIIIDPTDNKKICRIK
jgi:hypothetical protein